MWAVWEGTGSPHCADASCCQITPNTPSFQPTSQPSYAFPNTTEFATITDYLYPDCEGMYQAVTYVLNMCGQQESGNYIIRTANGNESLLEYTCTDPECTHCYSPNNIVCSAECSTTNVLTFPSSLYASFDQSGTYVYVVPDPDAVGGCSEEFIGYTVWNGDNRQCGDSPCCQLTPNIPTSFPTAAPTNPTSRPTSQPSSPTSLPTSAPTRTAFASVSYYSENDCESISQVVAYALNRCFFNGVNYGFNRAEGDDSLVYYTCTDSECTDCEYPQPDYYSVECSNSTAGVLTFPPTLMSSFDEPGIYYYSSYEVAGSCEEQYVIQTTWIAAVTDCGYENCCQVTPNVPTLQPTPQPTSPTSMPTSLPTNPTSQPTSLPTHPTSRPSSRPSMDIPGTEGYATVSTYNEDDCENLALATTYVLNKCVAASGVYSVWLAHGDTAITRYTCTDSECTYCESESNDYTTECSVLVGVLTFPSSLFAWFSEVGTYTYSVDGDGYNCAEQYIVSTSWLLSVDDDPVCPYDQPCCYFTPNVPTPSPSFQPTMVVNIPGEIKYAMIASYIGGSCGSDVASVTVYQLNYCYSSSIGYGVVLLSGDDIVQYECNYDCAFCTSATVVASVSSTVCCEGCDNSAVLTLFDSYSDMQPFQYAAAGQLAQYSFESCGENEDMMYLTTWFAGLCYDDCSYPSSAPSYPYASAEYLCTVATPTAMPSFAPTPALLIIMSPGTTAATVLMSIYFCIVIASLYYFYRRRRGKTNTALTKPGDISVVAESENPLNKEVVIAVSVARPMARDVECPPALPESSSNDETPRSTKVAGESTVTSTTTGGDAGAEADVAVTRKLNFSVDHGGADVMNALVVAAPALPLIRLPVLKKFLVPSEWYGLYNFLLKLFSVVSFLASFLTQPPDVPQAIAPSSMMFSWSYYVIVSFIIVPMFQNYKLFEPNSNDPVTCDKGCIYCKCCSVCCCSCRYQWQSRGKFPGEKTRYMPLSMYNLLFMAMNPGQQLNPVLDETKDISFGRAYLLLMSLNTFGYLEFYKFLNALYSLLYIGEDTLLSAVFAVLSVVSSTLAMKHYMFALYYSLIMFPVTLGWTLSFCCWTTPGANTVRVGTWSHRQLSDMWKRSCPK